MTRFAALTLAAAGLLAVPTLATAHVRHGDHDDRAAAQQVTIHIACFRGPWREIIWDHAEPSFTDDLVAYGYSYSEADAISTRVCRDLHGVDDPQYLVGVVNDILRTHPPR